MYAEARDKRVRVLLPVARDIGGTDAVPGELDAEAENC